MKTVFAAFALLVLSSSVAWAETDWSGIYRSFVGVRCEDPKTMAELLEAAKGLKFNDGGGATWAKTSDLRLARAETVGATANKLMCRVRFEYINRGSRKSQTGRYTIQIYNDGRWTTYFRPGT